MGGVDSTANVSGGAGQAGAGRGSMHVARVLIGVVLAAMFVALGSIPNTAPKARADTEPPDAIGAKFKSNRFPDAKGSIIVWLVWSDELFEETDIDRAPGEAWSVEVYDRGICTNVAHLLLTVPAN